MASQHSLDLTSGSVFKKLLSYSFPIFITALMQQLYHSADVFVVGNFAGTPEECKLALAAVGATGSITSLLLNAVTSIVVGVNVVGGQAYGNRDWKKLTRVASTSLIFGFFAGVVLAVAGCLFAPFLLEMIRVPHDIRGQALIYMRIIFLSQPAGVSFNFAAAVFRSRGNTKLSMKILTATGLVNVILNLIFVVCFDFDSAGVAMATAIANYVSAIVALYVLFHPQGEYALTLSDLRLYKKELGEILKIGLPTGLNSVLFQFSNTIVATAANALGTVTIAAVSAANSVNNVAHTFGSSLDSATIGFAAQNCGAGKLRRVDQMLARVLILGGLLFVGINTVLTLFPRFFLGIFSSNAAVVEAGIPKLMISSWGYILYLFMELISACQRGFGKSIVPTVVNIVCICFMRVAWIWWVYPLVPETAALSVRILWLYMCLPVSWGCSLLAQIVNYFCFVRPKEWKKQAASGKLIPEDMAYYEATKLKKA